MQIRKHTYFELDYHLVGVSNHSMSLHFRCGGSDPELLEKVNCRESGILSCMTMICIIYKGLSLERSLKVIGHEKVME